MNLNFKDKVKRSKIAILENKKRTLKSIKQNKRNKKIWCSWWAHHKLTTLTHRKIKNRCIITKRGSSIKKSFKLSRIELKRWVEHRLLFGVGISSW